MIFKRSIPAKEYKDYSQYRSLLRQDFKYTCAYCLIHEFHNGGEANFAIDHHCPQNGPHARPDLASTYSNLYWSCQECNSNKGDTWPEDAMYTQGFRFIDPCEEWGDHDLHWIFHHDGTLEAITNEGRYTEERLMLWRGMLKERRAQVFKDQETVVRIENLLMEAADSERRSELQARLEEVKRRLTPPIFHRPYRNSKPPARQILTNSAAEEAAKS